MSAASYPSCRGFLSLIFYLALATLTICCHGKPVRLSTAWRDEISQKASEYAEHVALPFLVSQMIALKIPGLKGSVKTPLGMVLYDLDKVKLNNVNIPKANLTLESDNELRMIAKDASLHVSANWAYREQPWPHISDSGTCDISVGGLSLGMLFDISTDIPKKKSSMHVKNCNLNVGKLSVKFHGGASWLYNLFSKEIERELRSSLGDKVCKSAEQLIDSKANKALDALAGMIKGFEGGT